MTHESQSAPASMAAPSRSMRSVSSSPLERVEPSRSARAVRLATPSCPSDSLDAPHGPTMVTVTTGSFRTGATMSESPLRSVWRSKVGKWYSRGAAGEGRDAGCGMRDAGCGRREAAAARTSSLMIALAVPIACRHGFRLLFYLRCCFAARFPHPASRAVLGYVQQRRPIVRPEPLAREGVYLLGRDGAVAVGLHVDERGIAKVRGKHRELVGALAHGLHGDGEVRLDEGDRAFHLFARHALVLDDIDLARDLALEDVGGDLGAGDDVDDEEIRTLG